MRSLSSESTASVWSGPTLHSANSVLNRATRPASALICFLRARCSIAGRYARARLLQPVAHLVVKVDAVPEQIFHARAFARPMDRQLLLRARGAVLGEDFERAAAVLD